MNHLHKVSITFSFVILRQISNAADLIHCPNKEGSGCCML